MVHCEAMACFLALSRYDALKKRVSSSSSGEAIVSCGFLSRSSTDSPRMLCHVMSTKQAQTGAFLGWLWCGLHVSRSPRSLQRGGGPPTSGFTTVELWVQHSHPRMPGRQAGYSLLEGCTVG